MARSPTSRSGRAVTSTDDPGARVMRALASMEAMLTALAETHGDCGCSARERIDLVRAIHDLVRAGERFTVHEFDYISRDLEGFLVCVASRAGEAETAAVADIFRRRSVLCEWAVGASPAASPGRPPTSAMRIARAAVRVLPAASRRRYQEEFA